MNYDVALIVRCVGQLLLNSICERARTITVERQPERNIAVVVKEIKHDMVKFKTNEMSRTAIHLTVFPPSNPLKHRKIIPQMKYGKCSTLSNETHCVSKRISSRCLAFGIIQACV
jgi:hypothetical protein